MAPPCTGKSLILNATILPNGAGDDTIGAVNREMPERSVAPGRLGRRTKEAPMTTTLVALVLLCLMTGTAMAQQAKVTSLMSKDLPENPGKEMLMITVEHAPGGSSLIHRHNAHALVYVLEGSVVMQVKGGKEVTLTPGQTFYEGPDDVHVVDRNASSTKPAKFLVVLIKDKGAPALVPVK
jgi:quercetin dioxygenase-like cupin family protein